MKKAFLILSIVFTALTFLGAGYVFYNHGSANAGYAIVPMILGIACIALYRTKGK